MRTSMLPIGGVDGDKTKVVIGTPTQARIDCGFKPRIIMTFDELYNSGGGKLSVYYNSDISPNMYKMIFNNVYNNRSLASDQQIVEVGDTFFTLGFPNLYSANTIILAIE